MQPTKCPQCRGVYGHKLDCSYRDLGTGIRPMSEAEKAASALGPGECRRCSDPEWRKETYGGGAYKNARLCERCWAYLRTTLGSPLDPATVHAKLSR